jgi:quinoprotein glucose dehydrogenase
MKLYTPIFGLVILALLAANLGRAETPATPAPSPPQISPASADGQQSIKGFRVPAELRTELFAAEPLLANPVAFFVDERGRVFVCETFRQGKGVEDNRGHGHWLDDDLAAQTVEDRLTYIQKHLKEKAIDYTKYDDRIRLLEDTDGDGKADKAIVFADRFNNIVNGTGAGVLVRGDNVYYTCIPDLWLLRDTDGDGKADERKSLHHGYGVRFAFRGHDMHGLCIGPDGKLYFSIGDRGYNVKTDSGHFVNPESGGVFRCNLDGSDLEVIYTGLRNPQELAFDDYGNLFTVDNNSDSGDKARLVYLAEGGESGWRMAFQYLPDRGPFNREKIWHPYHEGQPAFIVPPIANIADGPSGLAYYPGTGLSFHYKGRFFLCDFRGGPANSGIRTFRAKPKGAFFELADEEQTIWNILATDVDFGADGAIYVSDWVNGWNGEGKGRIYKFFDPEKASDPLVLEVKQLLSSGFTQRTSDELAKLLSHADRRVRQEAQFALADRADSTALTDVARTSKNRLARLHAIWGLGQVARRGGDSLSVLDAAMELLDDSDAEVRAQAAKVLGDARVAKARDKLIARLKDDSARVRYFAAQSLGKLGRVEAIGPLLEMLAANEDKDPILRHGGAMGLAGTKDIEALVAAGKHPSPLARMGVLLAMRKLQIPTVSLFLGDVDPRLVVEAARAIHDVPINDAMPQLAALISRSSQDEALLRRVLNANYRLGAQENANAVAAFAARADVPENMRVEAAQMLGSWATPSHRDRVLGMWRPLEPRDQQIAVAALRPALPGIFTGPTRVRAIGGKVAADLGIKEVGPALHGLLADKSQTGAARADALSALATLKDEKLNDALQSSLTDDQPAVRAVARQVLSKLRPADALEPLDEAIYKGELVERQEALATLATMTQPGTNAILSRALDKLIAGDIPADTQLDVLEAAARRASAEIKSKLTKYESARPSADPVALFHESLVGGDAERGRKIFFEKTEVSCVRCHKIAERGGEVGPDLSKIATDKKREYLLESIVDPNRTIAKNFETVMLATDDGQIHAGIVRHEDDQIIRLITAEGKLDTIDKATIEERKAGKSSMPEDLLKHLSKFEVRDLVEFLSGLK